MVNLPQTEILDFREYLFVDNARVRMLVSQLKGGVPETAVSKNSRSQKLMLGLKALGAENSRDRSSEDVMALSDLYVSMLEEDSEALRMLTDVSEDASTSEFWKRGGSRKRLKPGSLIRITAPTRLMDPKSITRVWRNFDTAFSNEAAQDISQILDGIESLYGEHLSVSIMPRGLTSPTKSFLGVIEHGKDFAALDRASLFSRLGPGTTELTSILQIARIPEESAAPMSGRQLAMKFHAAQRDSSEGRLNRSVLDEFLMGIMEMTEAYGLQSAPQWPAMAVTPLAIYRQISPYND